MELLDKPIAEPDVSDQLEALAQRYDRAGSPVIQLLNMVGGQAESLLDRLPTEVRDRLAQGHGKRAAGGDEGGTGVSRRDRGPAGMADDGGDARRWGRQAVLAGCQARWRNCR